MLLQKNYCLYFNDLVLDSWNVEREIIKAPIPFCRTFYIVHTWLWLCFEY